MRFTYIFLFLFFLGNVLVAQPTMRISEKDADKGTQVDIDFRIDNFSELVSFQFSIRWNPAVIQYAQLKNINTAMLPTFTAGNSFGTADAGDGIIEVLWDSPGITPVTLNNNTLMFTITFNVIGDVGTSSLVELSDDPIDIEFLTANVQNVGLIQQKGRVTVVGEAEPGTTLIASQEIGAQGSLVCVRITGEGITNIGAMQFTLRWTPGFMNFESVGATNIPNFGGGNVGPNNPDGSITVSYDQASGITRSNGELLFELCFRVLAGSGATDVTFSNNPLSIEIADVNGTVLQSSTRNGRVSLEGEPECEPDGFTIAIDNRTVSDQESFCLKVRTFNFTNIESFQFSMQWDISCLQFEAVRSFNLQGLGPGSFNLSQTSNGRLAVIWLIPDTSAVTLPNNFDMFEICFTAVGAPGMDTYVDVNEVMIPIEVTNDQGQVLPLHVCQGRVRKSDVVPITINVQNIIGPTCPNGTDGAISVSITGGNPPYTTFVWRRNGAQVGNSQNISGIGAGSYTLQVTDSNGNIGTSTVIMVNSQFNITIVQNLTNPTCSNSQDGSIQLNITGNTGNTTFNWSDIGSGSRDRAALSAGTYSLTITYGGGVCTEERSFTLNAPPAIVIQATVDNINGAISLNVTGGNPPYTYDWTGTTQTSASISGLSPGTYSVIVTDSNGCTATGGPYLITDSDDLILDTDVSDFNGFGVSCFNICNGTISVTPLNGTPPFTYQWSGGGSTAELTNRCAGTYTVIVTDAGGKTATTSVIVTTPERLRINIIDFTMSTGIDGAATVEAIGGIPPYQYRWSDSNNTNGPSISGQAPETILVSVEDQNGCTASLPVNFAELRDCYDHRKVITPNGDGLNDELLITCLSGTVNTLDIFDRWGKLVISRVNYSNDWAGTGSDGRVLPDGAYFFVLKVTETAGPERIVRGSFTLLNDLR